MPVVPLLASLVSLVPVSEPSPAAGASATIVRSLDGNTLLSRPTHTPLGSPPITMSWAGQSFGATGGATGAQAQAHDELPPEYSQVRAPTTRMEYTFSSNGYSSMLVLPPSDCPDTRPIYHISSALDPFIPTAGVTTVCRGAHADGAFVGEFEWGLTRAVPTITMGVRQVEARVAMKQTAYISNTTTYSWHWGDGRGLRWVAEERDDSATAKCYLFNGRDTPDPQADLLAIFHGRQLNPRLDKRRQSPRTLEVFPRAHDGPLLDYIIMGVLMLERKRLSPWLDRDGGFDVKGDLQMKRRA